MLDAPTLNPLMAAGRATWSATRPHLLPCAGLSLHLPFEPADYVDFYASEHHAANLGRMFRPGSPPLTPNWKHLPIGYHGRAGSLAVSGTPVTRPAGQRKRPDEEAPSFGPSGRLDFEAEVGFIVGTLDIALEVSVNGVPLTRPPFAGMYWTAAQQLAQLTSNGARLRTGDLFASGTVSGPERETVGSLIEYTRNGEHPLKLADGTGRAFLEDGDEVSITATAPGPGRTRIGFGQVTGHIVAVSD